MVASAVAFALGEAPLPGVSPTAGFLLPTASFSAFQIKRSEQNSPESLIPVQNIDWATTDRIAGADAGQGLNGENGFRYALAPLPGWSNPFCLRLNSCESPRAPPRMDPPFSC